MSKEDVPSDEDAVRMHIFSATEEKKYLKAAEQYAKLWSLAQLMKLEGCRPEELLSTEVGHVNLGQRRLRIETTKSKHGKRTLRIRPESLPIFKHLLSVSNGPWLFPSERSQQKKLSLSTVENWHVEVRDQTKIACVIYDWRHTFATRAANDGMSLATLARILGHGSLRSVMKYVHPDQAEQDRAMDKLSDPTRTKAGQKLPRKNSSVGSKGLIQ